MIEKMKVVHIVTTASKKKQLISDVRDLGVIHFSQKENADHDITERFNDLSKKELLLKDYVTNKKEKGIVLGDEEFEKMYESVNEAVNSKDALLQKKNAAKAEIDRVEAWGEFSPSELKKLKDEGFDIHFYQMGKKEYELAASDETVKLIRLSSVDKMETVAVLGTMPDSIPANEFKPSNKSISELKEEIDECDLKLKQCDKVLRDASKYLPSFADQMLKTQNKENFSSMTHTAASDDDLVWMSGYIPVDELEAFKSTATEKKWAWALADPQEDDELIPTKVKYNKLARIISPIFDILGTVPGYHEYDISFWFLLFFALFFAMIIGDAGYGALFLIGTIVFIVKSKKTSDATLLLLVLSVSTIIWGAITGTWFGSESAMNIPFFRAMVIPSFANYPQYFGVDPATQQNTIMKFAFVVGAAHISLACILSIRRKLKEKDLSLVADVGWLIATIALYFMILYLVIGEKIKLVPVAIAVGVAFLLVVLFGGMSPDKSFSQGLKAGLGNTFTVFLDTISCFGNVMSYIRLFAVGMASLAIAQSFNNMAAGFSGPLVVVGGLIVIIGHVLNIVMGILSVVVHGVRLNLLEFSGQLGMEWTGIKYEPFKKNDKIKK